MKFLRKIAAYLALAVVVGPFGNHRVTHRLLTAGRLHLQCSCGGDLWWSIGKGAHGGTCVAGRVIRWGGLA